MFTKKAFLTQKNLEKKLNEKISPHKMFFQRKIFLILDEFSGTFFLGKICFHSGKCFFIPMSILYSNMKTGHMY
jgi:hypothetical protein